MILPCAIDLEIAPGQALTLEAAAAEECNRCGIARQAGRLEPVQGQVFEGKLLDQRQRRRHVALAREGGADPIAQRGALGDAAADIRQSHGAEQRLARGPKDEERIGGIVFDITPVVLHPGAKGGSGEIIGRPQGLPRREKLPAMQPQVGPVFVVGHVAERNGQEATFEVFNERLALVKFSDGVTLGFDPLQLLLPSTIDEKGVGFFEIRQCTQCDQFFPLTAEETASEQEPTACPACAAT